MDFRWNQWNIEHLAGHGVDPLEAETVIEHAAPPYPLARNDGKRVVWGRGSGGRFLQAVFVLDDDDAIYVIHARPLTDREKRRFRRRERS